MLFLKMVFNIILVFVLITKAFVHCQRSNEAIDSAFIESMLDAEECNRQIEIIRRNVLLGIQFVDAGIRFPRGVLQGGLLDLGNYHQCLAIEHATDGMPIQGKYCSISGPIDPDSKLPYFQDTLDSWNIKTSLLNLDEEAINKIKEYNMIRAEMLALSGNLDSLKEYYDRTLPESLLSGSVFTVGVCIPKPCTPKQAVNALLFNITAFGSNFRQNYCRIPGDKPWASADIVAVVIFSLIGIATLVSTSYDLINRFLLDTDVKQLNPIYLSFSVYTNGKQLVTYNSRPGTMQCIDGIRTIAMMWVIIGHTFGSEPHLANPLEVITWVLSANSLWITVAPMTVDTFFTLGGILLVYTTVGKMTGKTLLKNLHFFYLVRIVRIMPMLAVTVLLQASFFNHIADGPSWQAVAGETNKCRNYWWYTLLFVQNLFNTTDTCVGHSWYIAIDMQLYIVSPLVLYWVFTGKKRNAWLALTAALMIILVSSTIYNFHQNLQAGVMVPSRWESRLSYMPLYYLNPLTRAAPFFVGLISGYVLYLYRGKKVHIPWIIAILFWICSFGTLGSIFYFKYRIQQFDWDNQFLDNFMNSFMRPAWACAISWIIFACVHGYGGPVNWFLSLDVWRLPARLTYGMYLLHYPFMYTINGTMMTPAYFTVGSFTFKFLSYLVVAAAASYVLTILVDYPVTNLYKQLMVKAQPKKSSQTKMNAEKNDDMNKVYNTQTAINESETRQTNGELQI